MSMTMGFGVYNTYKKMLKSFGGYLEAIVYIKSLKNVDYVEVQYLFAPSPQKVIVTKSLYIQRFTESGGGVEPWGPKYYFRKDKF
jgi:hypothetical protein